MPALYVSVECCSRARASLSGALGARHLPRIAAELNSIRYRNGLEEVEEDVLSILRRICRAGLELL